MSHGARLALATAGLLLFCTAPHSPAYAAVDPTRPQAAGTVLVPLRPAPVGGFRLSAVLHGSARSIAIVNGQPRVVGERMGRYRIESIEQHCVHYSHGLKRERVCLKQAPSVLKPVSGRTE
jgi:hypothetical protein